LKPYLCYFFAYAFLGWCAEVAFAAVKNHRFVNRGFLSGPVCPIYGFGIVSVLFCLTLIQNNLLSLYAGSVVLTTVLELITGFAMEKLFHQRWWDYSKMPLNIGGYVCVPFSLLWGVACVAIVDLLQPLIARLTSLLPEPLSTVLLAAFILLFILDTVVALTKAFRLDSGLRHIDEIASALRTVSDRLGETVANGALTLLETDEYAKNSLQTANILARDALRENDEKIKAELKTRYAELVASFEREHRRMLKAFPQLRSLRYPSELESAKEKLTRWLEKRGHR
jgi:uncharacterized membrane protein